MVSVSERHRSGDSNDGQVRTKSRCAAQTAREPHAEPTDTLTVAAFALSPIEDGCNCKERVVMGDSLSTGAI